MLINKNNLDLSGLTKDQLKYLNKHNIEVNTTVKEVNVNCINYDRSEKYSVSGCEFSKKMDAIHDDCEDGFVISNFIIKHLIHSIDMHELLKKINEAKPSGEISNKLFKMFKLTGTSYLYDVFGDVLSETQYKNGLEHGSCMGYFNEGTISSDYNYKNGLEHGSCKVFYSDSSFKSIDIFINGDLHGVCKTFHENGMIQFLNNYKFGKRNGVCEKYSKTGVLYCKRIYENDSVIEDLI